MRPSPKEVAKAFIETYGLFNALQQAKEMKSIFSGNSEEDRYWEDVIMEIREHDIRSLGG